MNKKKEMMKKGGEFKVEIVGLPPSMLEDINNQDEQDASPRQVIQKAKKKKDVEKVVEKFGEDNGFNILVSKKDL